MVCMEEKVYLLRINDWTGQSIRSRKDRCIYLHYGGERREDFFLVSATTGNIQRNVAGSKDYFIPRRNIMFKRFKFNSQVQQQDELVDAFIPDVHAKADQCAFGNFKDELIHDRIVVAILDAKLSGRLQLKQNLLLQETITAAKQAEIQHKQNQVIRDKYRTEHQVCSTNQYTQRGGKS